MPLKKQKQTLQHLSGNAAMEVWVRKGLIIPFPNPFVIPIISSEATFPN